MEFSIQETNGIHIVDSTMKMLKAVNGDLIEESVLLKTLHHLWPQLPQLEDLF